jgi:hypothetical protein
MQSTSRGIGPASRCKAALIVRVKFTETAGERASWATAAPSHYRRRKTHEKWFPAGGGLRLALPPAGVGNPLPYREAYVRLH